MPGNKADKNKSNTLNSNEIIEESATSSSDSENMESEGSSGSPLPSFSLPLVAEPSSPASTLPPLPELPPEPAPKNNDTTSQKVMDFFTKRKKLIEDQQLSSFKKIKQYDVLINEMQQYMSSVAQSFSEETQDFYNSLKTEKSKLIFNALWDRASVASSKSLKNKFYVLKNLITQYDTLKVENSLKQKDKIYGPNQPLSPEQEFLIKKLDVLSHLINLTDDILLDNNFKNGPGVIKDNRFFLQKLKAMFEVEFETRYTTFVEKKSNNSALIPEEKRYNYMVNTNKENKLIYESQNNQVVNDDIYSFVIDKKQNLFIYQPSSEVPLYPKHFAVTNNIVATGKMLIASDKIDELETEPTYPCSTPQHLEEAVAIFKNRSLLAKKYNLKHKNKELASPSSYASKKDPLPEHLNPSILIEINQYMAKRALETGSHLFGYSAKDYKERVNSWLKILKKIRSVGSKEAVAFINKKIKKFDRGLSNSRYVALLQKLSKQLDDVHDHRSFHDHLMVDYKACYEQQIKFAEDFRTELDARTPNTDANKALTDYRTIILRSHHLESFLTGEQLLQMAKVNIDLFATVSKFFKPFLNMYRALGGEVVDPAKQENAINNSFRVRYLM